MIARVWHGWTALEDAAEYERLLKEEIFPGIAARGVTGYTEIQLFRRDHESAVEFKTVMWFDSLEAVRRFAGDDYEQSSVPPKARALLTRFDDRSQHYEVREALEY